MEKSRGSVRDWIILAKENGIDLSRLDSDKEQDMRNLGCLELPIYESYACSFLEFSYMNMDLVRFMSQYAGFTARAIPFSNRKDLPRKPKTGLRSFDECFTFLSEVVRGNERDYRVILSEWQPQIYGGVLISSSRQVLGEIGEGLDTLCFGQEIPLASFRFDRARIGHMEDKTEWLQNLDEDARYFLWRAFMHIKKGDDSFDPFLLKGYFEFVVTEEGDIKFVDYKDNESYLA